MQFKRKVFRKTIDACDGAKFDKLELTIFGSISCKIDRQYTSQSNIRQMTLK